MDSNAGYGRLWSNNCNKKWWSRSENEYIPIAVTADVMESTKYAQQKWTIIYLSRLKKNMIC
jgi:ribosomal protein L28